MKYRYTNDYRRLTGESPGEDSGTIIVSPGTVIFFIFLLFYTTTCIVGSKTGHCKFSRNLNNHRTTNDHNNDNNNITIYLIHLSV